MKVVINQGHRKVRDFRKTWKNTLDELGFLSGDPKVDKGVIGDIYESPSHIYLDSPDLPDEALEILKGYYGSDNIGHKD